MFRNEYKQANDNIKIDEALVEKTISAAFDYKPKKNVYSYRPVTSIAAAVVLVIGVSVAYPELTKEPVTETTIIETEPQSTQWNDMSFEPVSATPEVKTTPVSDKPKKKSSPVSSNTSAPVTTTVPHQVEIIDNNAEVAAADDIYVEEPALARSGGAVPEAYSGEAMAENEFTLTSSNTLEDGTLVYSYENGEGKSFTLSISDSDNISVTGIQFLKDGKTYTLQSENMTSEELTQAYEKLEI